MGFRVPSGGGKSGGKGGFRIPTTRPDAPSSKFKPFKNVSIPKVSPVRGFSPQPPKRKTVEFIQPEIAPDLPYLINAKYGTLSDPVDGGSSLNSGSTWILPQFRPFEQTLKEFKIYCSVGGTVKLKLLTPSNGGFNVSDIQTLTCGIGLNSFSVDGLTLNETTIPPNSLLGIKPGTATVRYLSDSTELNAGYINVLGDVLGSNIVLASYSYKHEIQAQFSAEFMSDAAVSTYIINDDCSGNVVPQWGINTTTAPWTFSGGNCVNAGVGLANYLDFYPTTNLNDNFFRVRFRFVGAGARFAIYKKPILIDAGSTTGTIIEADLDANKLKFYGSWLGGTTYTLPSVQSEIILSSLTLITGRTYELELSKNKKVLTAKITDTTNGDNQSLSVNNDPTKLAGLSYGRFGFAAIAGAVNVNDIKAGIVRTGAKTIVVGNSFIEGSGATNQDLEGFANLLVINNNASASGDGGTLLRNIMKRIRFELRYNRPKYVVVESVNNINSPSEVTDYATDMAIVYQTIVNAGATPIICVPTPNSDPTKNARIIQNQTFLFGQPWNLCRFDIALSVGGDGVTYNAALMNDGVHPNTAGHLAIYNRLLTQFPDLI
jgi:hypothetical protein